MNSTTKCPDLAELDDLLDERLSNERQLVLQEHLEVCAQCQEQVANLDLDAALVSNLQAPRAIIDTELHAVINEIKSNSNIGETSDVALREVSLDFLDSSDDPEFLGRLGRYQISELVGRGGMGVVLKGCDPLLKRIVAIKVLAPELATNANARKRFRREGQAAAAVSHDHVVTIHGVDEANELPHLVMEYISGRSLQDRISADGPLELKEILRIGLQAADGLAAAHAQGLVHRDIKPANILLENGVERVKITDFGLAHAVDDVRITRPGVVTGTPEYMSPEQACSEPFDHRSDLFSLGCVLYAMCTGRPPFRADSTVAMIRRVCDDQPRRIQEINSDIPVLLANVVEKLLNKSPDDRFQSAAEVRELLGRYLAHIQNPTLNPSPIELINLTGIAAPLKNSGKHHTWVTAAMVMVLSLGGLGFAEVSGVTSLTRTVIRLVHGEGVLVIEVDDPNVAVEIDGDQLVITGAGPKEIRLPRGQYDVKAHKDGNTVHQQLVSVTRGGTSVVRVHIEADYSERSPRKRKVWDNAMKRGAPSPDGRYLTFTDWETGDLAVRDLVERTNHRLTNKGPWSDSGSFAFFHVWSPDGKEVAYTWHHGDGYDLRRIGRNGGDSHVISQHYYLELYAWSPDGAHILAAVWDTDESIALSAISVEDGSVRVLKEGYAIDASISPDGRYVVYDAPEQEGSEDRDIHILAFDGSAKSVLIAERGNDYAPLWTPDGEAVVFMSDRSGNNRLWIMPVEGMLPRGPAEPTGINMDLMSPMGLTQDGGYFYGNVLYDANTDIFVSAVDPVNAKLSATPAKMTLPYQGFNARPSWSPDGRRLAYVSQRNRQRSLVVRSDRGGDEKVVIPRANDLVYFLTQPLWSPDGSTILLCGGRENVNSGWGIFTVEVQTGEVSRLVEPSNDLPHPFAAAWSSDGKRVYYIRRGEPRVVEVNRETGEERTFHELAPTDRRDERPMPLAHSLAASANGRFLAFSRRRTISIMPTGGGAAKIIAYAPEGQQISAKAGIVWNPDSGSLIYATGVYTPGQGLYSSLDQAQIWQVNVAGGEPKSLGEEIAELEFLSIHPDGRQLAFSASSPGQAVPDGIWVLENFLPTTKTTEK